MNTLIERIKFPELFFGFVAPIGADLDQAVCAFRDYFKAQEYNVVELKVTDIYQILKLNIVPNTALATAPPQARYDSYIKYGDQLRETFSDDSFLAATTIANIIRKREKFSQTDKYSKTVYLLHQFKRREEIALMRAVYGEAFFQVSVYSRRGARVDNLARKFAAGQNSSNINTFRSQAELLVQTDENESSQPHGQQVGKIFHNADFIVSLDEHTPNIEDQVRRFCELLFSSNKISPTKMEHGMYLAHGAALRSLDLSRQVGACILDPHGQIICLGANDVPKATGGTYWADERFDDRDFRRGFDSNEQRKREILSEILRIVGQASNIEDLLKDPKIQDSQLMDALEYTRVIHAEMNALCDAAKSGRSGADAVLYCTTFPCHICAKHIIAAGLAQVVFLEPYPKSLTFQLHNDAVQIEGGDRGQYADFPSVKFIHFFGVTPRRYQKMFERGRRKSEGGAVQEYRNDSKIPFISIKTPFYTQPELLVLEAQKKTFKELLGVDETKFAQMHSA